MGLTSSSALIKKGENMALDSLTTIANRDSYKKSHTAVYDSNVNGATILSPVAGKTLKIKGIAIDTAAATGSVRLFFSDDENDQENTVYKFYADGENNHDYIPVHINGDKDAVLKMTSDLGGEFFLIINYSDDV